MNAKLEKRRNEMIKLINANGHLTTSYLANYFKVTSETIRSDLKYLERIGYVEIVHGGATITSHVIDDVSNAKNKKHTRYAEKNLIADLALSLIPKNSFIYLDGGTTISLLAEKIVERNDLTIVTPSLLVVSAVLRQHEKNTTCAKLYTVGSYADLGNMMLRSSIANEPLQSFRFAVAFLGTTGIKFHNGPTTGDYGEMLQKRQAIANSEYTVVLCDSNKFQSGGITRYANWNEINCLITNSAIPDGIHKTMCDLAPDMKIIVPET